MKLADIPRVDLVERAIAPGVPGPMIFRPIIRIGVAGAEGISCAEGEAAALKIDKATPPASASRRNKCSPIFLISLYNLV